MNRRMFFKKSCGGMLMLTCPDFGLPVDNKKVCFGLVADLHFAHKEKWETRFFNQSKLKLEEAVRVFNSKGLDFIIELGDLKDQGTTPDRIQTLSFLDEIEKTMQTFNGPIYHVLGNHDMDSISKKDFLSCTHNKGVARGKSYYSFLQGGIKFIVLDANFNVDGSDYDSGNFVWTKAMIPADQKDWLQKELEESCCPVVVFVHQLLDVFSDISKEVCVGNAEEIVNVLEQCKKVIAVFQGHHHYGHYSIKEGIHYFTMKGMVEGSLPDHNSFAVVEIDNDLNIYLEGFCDCENKSMNKC